MSANMPAKEPSVAPVTQGMDVSIQEHPDGTLSPLHPSQIEREVLSARSLDKPARDEIMDRMRFTAFSMLAGAIIRDAKYLLRCKLVHPTHKERAAYVAARRDTIADYLALFPQVCGEKTGFPSSSPIIDVTPTKLLPVKPKAKE